MSNPAIICFGPGRAVRLSSLRPDPVTLSADRVAPRAFHACVRKWEQRQSIAGRALSPATGFPSQYHRTLTEAAGNAPRLNKYRLAPPTAGLARRNGAVWGRPAGGQLSA